ncbi:hypothetical protein GCM10011309_22650 [Litorimonas cladophorae]|uniref:DUF3806 domain-containing protein n=1 Tax=Litorimonas cladophorae TaxID=1220491 RepID=A0A918NJF1_9PROT|nr:DUF3806 domain-containing protein [Litorimonas cladophorae]GGX71902.1 hypothetical protein GCM10011309_22650 [Litorimonas cladophorae]
MQVRDLNTAELASLQAAFDLLARIAGEDHPMSFLGLQNVYNTILSDKPDFPALVISLGLGFGQKFVETGRYEWVIVSDEYGQETCISPKQLKINVAPISIVQKRVDENLSVDLKNLFEETDKAVKDLIESGKYDKR